ncbi:MAG: amidohydrolase [Eubacteriales bacterium]
MKKLYYGGSILTMCGENPEALLCENGIITAVGTLENVRRHEGGAEYIDLRGKCLIPAFIDSHSHITALAGTLGLCALGGADSTDEIKRRISIFKKTEATVGGWVMGFGYDNNLLEGGAHPDRKMLDEICPDLPLMITHASGHMGVLNSRALAALDITRETENPDGGRIGHYPDGEPNGYLEETAFTVWSARIPRGETDIAAKIRRAEDIYFSHGIATIQDGLTRRSEWTLLSSLAAAGHLRADIVSYPDMKLCPEIVCENVDYNNYRGHLRIGGYKIFLDGSPQGRTAYMSEPYESDEYRGYPIYSDAEVRAFVERAENEGRQLLAHCNGDAAAEQFIAAYEQVTKGRVSVSRPVMIHAQLVRRDQLRRMAALGMTASFFAAHIKYWGDAHINNFGMSRAAYISPLASAERCGVNFTLHQDSPVIAPDMLESVQCAVRRVTSNGVTLAPDEKIGVMSALKAVTRSAAYQYGEESGKGILAQGCRADMVILSRSPLEVQTEDIEKITVQETIKDGITVYKS